MRCGRLFALIILLPIVFTIVSACQTMPSKPLSHSVTRIEVIEFRDLPGLERTNLRLGGFSGLAFKGDLSGRLTFITHTDRGPNGEPLADKAGEKTIRPFVDSKFQPRWVQFSLDSATKTLRLDQQSLLTENGRPLSGLPNRTGQGFDETPVDLKGQALPKNPMGMDLEGIAIGEDGSYWMGEEYRPSLLKFSSEGKLLSRWVPEGSPKGTGTEALPNWYLKRQLNRGFEGVAAYGGVIYGFLQSGLVGDDANITRILGVDMKSGKPVSEYSYVFEPTPKGAATVDKIGDAVALPDGSFLVIEQNTVATADAVHNIYRVSTKNAENIVSRALSPLTKDNARAVSKTLVADLVLLGLGNYEKVEGLAVIDAKTLALVTDNDFGATGKGENPAFVLVHLAEPLF